MYKAKHLPKFHLPHIPPPHPASQFLSPLFHSHPKFFKKSRSPKIQISQ